MATGTGSNKNRHTLIDIFLLVNQAQRVLFLEDRVDRTITKVVKEHIPYESCGRKRTYLLNDFSETARIRGARVLVYYVVQMQIIYFTED